GRPGFARVVARRAPPARGAPRRRPRAPAAHPPRRALGLPEGGEEPARVPRIQGEIGGAGALAAGEHVLPRPATVLRAEHAALAVGAEGVPESGNIDELRIPWIDAHARDVSRVAEAQVRPRAAAVSRAIDTVAVGDVAANAALSGADVDHVGIGRGDGDGADGRGPEEAVGDVLPRRPPVGGLPHPARAGAEVEGHGIDGIARHRHHAAAAVRTDQAPSQRVEDVRIDGHRYTSARSTREGYFPRPQTLL